MRIALSLTALAVALVTGCNKSPEGGNPGTNDKFTITGPSNTIPTHIKQGNKETVKLSIDRGKDFKRDVKLTVSGVPEKVTAKLNKDTIKASEGTDFTLDIDVGKEAALGEHTIKVTGTPDGGGSPTSVDVKIEVDKNP
jgi:uncharacterized membrane protein